VSRLALYAAAFVAGVVALPFIGLSSVWGTIISGFLVGLVIPLVEGIAEETPRFVFWLRSARIGGERVRISASYLYRIKVDGEYLLVRSNRRRDHFQPVGGVFKALPDGRAYLQSIGALDDTLIPIDHSSRDDLRIRLPGKRLPEFLRWYDSRLGRESDAWREFHEELIAPGILDRDVFPYAYARFVRQVRTPIRYSAPAQSAELLIADIYELLPTGPQLAELERLRADGHPDIRWADEGRIRRRGAEPGAPMGFPIPETAEWTL